MNTQVFEYDSEPTADIPVVKPRRRGLTATRPVVALIFGIGVLTGCLAMSVWHDFSEGLRQDAVKDFLRSPVEREQLLAEAEQPATGTDGFGDVEVEAEIVGHAVNETTRIEILVADVCGFETGQQPEVLEIVENGGMRLNGETVWSVDDVAVFVRGDVVDFDCPQS